MFFYGRNVCLVSRSYVYIQQEGKGMNQEPERKKKVGKDLESPTSEECKFPFLQRQTFPFVRIRAEAMKT